jgi:DNA-binding HxlR family transcriptional regulator
MLYHNWLLEAHDHPTLALPVTLTLEALGDHWRLSVLRDLMFGNRRHF